MSRGRWIFFHALSAVKTGMPRASPRDRQALSAKDSPCLSVRARRAAAFAACSLSNGTISSGSCRSRPATIWVSLPSRANRPRSSDRFPSELLFCALRSTPPRYSLVECHRTSAGSVREASAPCPLPPFAAYFGQDRSGFSLHAPSVSSSPDTKAPVNSIGKVSNVQYRHDIALIVFNVGNLSRLVMGSLAPLTYGV